MRLSAGFAICERNTLKMKGQDILVLLKLVAKGKEKWAYAQLAEELGMSSSEIHAAIKRCGQAGLYNPYTRRQNSLALAEFLNHGVRYVFPAQPGPIRQGIPTSYAAEPLRQRIQFLEKEAPVMPLLHGPVRGPEIQPLYPSAPEAASRDEHLHRLLALVDALRSGRARERKIASEILNRELEVDEAVV
jgi:hypothetical protein